MRDQRLPTLCVADRGMRLVGDPSGDWRAFRAPRLSATVFWERRRQTYDIYSAA